ncbi:MAG: ATP-binding protein [Polyangiaceae bacterium]|nr:ATP-binding protein [Polyangiaceae bacterium]
MRSTPPSADFFGREDLLAELLQFEERGFRMVSLVGLAGVGKTRTAKEFALRAGVSSLSIDLTDCTSAEDVVLQTSRALGVDLSTLGGSTNFAGHLAKSIAALEPRLLLLDGVDGIEKSALRTLLAQWSSLVPTATFVLTANSPLGIENEIVRTVLPLRTDSSAQDPSGAEEMLLFCVRQRAGLRISDKAQLHDLAVALEGIPLAIELVSAQLETRSVAEVFALLRTPPTDPTDGLGWITRRSIGHSFAAVGAEAIEFLIRVSAFSAPFSVDECAAVLGLGNAGVRITIGQLQRCSLLLRADSTEGRAARFRVPGPARFAAMEHKEANAWKTETRLAYESWVVELARTIVEEQTDVVTLDWDSFHHIEELALELAPASDEAYWCLAALAYFAGFGRPSLPMAEPARRCLLEKPWSRAKAIYALFVAHLLHSVNTPLAIELARASKDVFTEERDVGWTLVAQAFLDRDAEFAAELKIPDSVSPSFASWIFSNLGAHRALSHAAIEEHLKRALSLARLANRSAMSLRCSAAVAWLNNARGEYTLANEGTLAITEEADKNRLHYLSVLARVLRSHALAMLGHDRQALEVATEGLALVDARFGPDRFRLPLLMTVGVLNTYLGDIHRSLELFRIVERDYPSADETTLLWAGLSHTLALLWVRRSEEALSTLRRFQRPASNQETLRFFDYVERLCTDGKCTELPVAETTDAKFFSKALEAFLLRGSYNPQTLWRTREGFRLQEGGDVLLDKRKPALYDLIDHLATNRQLAPGEWVDLPRLVDRLWPEERLPPDALRKRLTVLVARARALGLRPYLESSGKDSWRLSPDVEVHDRS